MNRRKFFGQSALYTFLWAKPWGGWLAAQGLEIEEGEPTPAPIPEPHFPDRLYLFVWRNWELANADRMAKVLGATAEKVLEIGASMGLPPKPHLTEDQLRRIYITVIRQNWHVVPDDQLMELLGWNQQHYEYILKEDDYLFIKLGLLKPRCERLRYEEPSAAARQRAEEIRRLVQETTGSTMEEPGEPAFQFVDDLSSTRALFMRDPRSKPGEEEVDLTHGWTLKKPGEGSGIPNQMIKEFQAYLRSAFGCDVGLAERTEMGERALEVAVNSSLVTPAGSFEVIIEPESIRVVGRDLAGAQHGLYYLQDQMEEREGPYLATRSIRRTTHLDPRYAYAYFALYGDPLMVDIDPFPDGFLEKLARAGVNGVWLQAVLWNLAPSKVFPEFGEGCEKRLASLNRLVERSRRHGVNLYLYINEPRPMPADFFAHYPDIKGTHHPLFPNSFAMCTSVPKVRQWLSESLAYVFSRVPGLGGVFAITMSENLTNCFSRGDASFCPRCSKRKGSDVVAEVIQSIRDGVRSSSGDAEVIAWDWGWGFDWVPNGADSSEVIERLPKDVALLSVSEWDQPVDRGGVHTKVNEYSISVVGPGPRALRNWGLARERDLTTMAKVAWNNTWEICAVPYIPVPNLIVQHCENLLKTDIQGLMVSWTLGGYPSSPNFEVAQAFYFSPAPDGIGALRRIAERRYGQEAAPAILEAWKAFSVAFEEFPYGVALYLIPTNYGPANPLRLDSTGYTASMSLFPYDDYRTWVGQYPVEIAEKQFEKMAKMWETGLECFREALPRVRTHKQEVARKDLGIAETCYLHFQSVANQIRFYRLRTQWESAKPENRAAISARMIKIAEHEIQLAKRQYAIARHDSTIGYNASEHYYYRPLDLIEKVLNCHQVIETLGKLNAAQSR